MQDQLVGTCYELKQEKNDKTFFSYFDTCQNDKTYIQFYDVFETEEGLVFQKSGRTAGFECQLYGENEEFLKIMCSLQEQGYLSKAQWLEKRKQNKSSFDLSIEGMLQSSYLKDFEPLDIEKTALIYEIIKALGYFNVEDIKVIYALVTAYGYEKEVDRIVSITQFLVQLGRKTPMEDTDLVKKHSDKILSFHKFFRKDKNKK